MRRPSILSGCVSRCVDLAPAQGRAAGCLASCRNRPATVRGRPCTAVRPLPERVALQHYLQGPLDFPLRQHRYA